MISYLVVMQNKLLIITRVFIIWLLASTSLVAQPQQWQETQVGDSVTVKFPSTPTRQETTEGVVYLNKGEQIIFLILSKQKALVADASPNELKEFYTGTLKGMLEGGGGKIVNQQTVDLKGFPAVRAQLAMDKNSKIKGPYFNQIVLVNGTCYAQSVVMLGEATPTLLADKDSFFSSFRTTKHRLAPGDPQTHTAAYQLGRLFGKVIFYGGLVALVLFFLRRKSKVPK